MQLKNMVVFDTNAILRYILQDNEEMAGAVEKQIQQHNCFIPTEVIAEMVYILSKVYSVDKSDIVTAIKGVLSVENVITPDYETVEKGLEAYLATNLDFVDCLMVGYQCNGYTVFTFDKKLKKYLYSVKSD